MAGWAVPPANVAGFLSARLDPRGRVVLLIIVLTVHVAVCGGLIFLVLLHSGKGGGLSDMFGGGLGATAAGSTVVEKNLDRITLMAALLFTITSVSLAFLMDK
jgi:preprotein translocase subunit SecG